MHQGLAAAAAVVVVVVDVGGGGGGGSSVLLLQIVFEPDFFPFPPFSFEVLPLAAFFVVFTSNVGAVSKDFKQILRDAQCVADADGPDDGSVNRDNRDNRETERYRGRSVHWTE